MRFVRLLDSESLDEAISRLNTAARTSGMGVPSFFEHEGRVATVVFASEGTEKTLMKAGLIERYEGNDMTPEDLCKNGSESGEQKALFAWAAMAYRRGFVAALDMHEYTVAHEESRFYASAPVVPELRWLHAIPNGGLRDPRTAARMKAEGVKPGVADICLPLRSGRYVGLYVELKREKGASRVADEQWDFNAFVSANAYFATIAYGWRNAATIISDYITGTT